MQAVLARHLITAAFSVAAVATAIATGVRYVEARESSGMDAVRADTGNAPVGDIGAAPATAPSPDKPAAFAGGQARDLVHSFYFARAAYPSGDGRGFGGRGSAFTDWPNADRVIITVLGRLMNVDVQTEPFAIDLDDENLSRYPFLYAVEVGGMALRQREIDALRHYLLAGGFLVVDDFWGNEWRNFEYWMTKVLPEYELEEITIEHPIFHTVYDVKDLVQIPYSGNARSGSPTNECTPCPPRLFGIFDDKGRMMVIVNWNTDLGDAWEWAEDPSYPLAYSTYAYQMGANFIIYSMTR